MQFFVGSRLSAHMARLRDGSLLCMSVPVARTGVQYYKAQELASMGGELPAGYASNEMIPVRRPAEEVLSTRTMASLEGVPICDTHPPSFVTPQNFSTWQSGHLQNVRPGPRTPDGEQTVMGDMIVRDGNLADKIERGLMRQVSVGYDCVYDWDGKGFVQRNILANHVAVVPVARGGEALQIMDAMPEPDWERLGATLARAMQYPECWGDVRETLEILAEMK
jgi:hypothetical protein